MEEMDMLQGVKEAIKDASGSSSPPSDIEDFVAPSIEEMLEALEKMNLTDGDKEGLKNLLLQRTEGDNEMMNKFFKPAFDVLPTENPFMQYVLILAFILVVAIFVFFGYKLYKSLTEKERKRDEKRKQKQMKKKK